MEVGDFVMSNYPPGGYYEKESDPKTTLVYIVMTAEGGNDYRLNYACRPQDLPNLHKDYTLWREHGVWMNHDYNLRPATAHDMVQFLFTCEPRKEIRHEFRASLLSKLKETYGEPPYIDLETDTSQVPDSLSEKLLNGSIITPTPTSDGKPGVAFVDMFSSENNSWVRVTSTI